MSRIFRPLDYVQFLADDAADLKKVVERARRVENAIVEPTLRDRAKMSALLLDFIKRKGRIVYGGFAINTLVKVKTPADAFYDFEAESPDIEFYSSDAAVDVKDLCDLFHNAGYKYIRGTEAFHAETYKVAVNLVQICDVTYVPKNVQRAIPFVLIDGVKYAHPHFLLIDSLRILTDPATSYWRLDKAFPRMYVLQKNYPLVKPEGHEQNLTYSYTSATTKDIIETALAFLSDLGSEESKEGELAILIGYAAYAAYDTFSQSQGQGQEQSQGQAKPYAGIPILEVVLTQYEKTVPKLFKRLRDKFGDEVTYEEHQRFFDYCGRRGHVYYGGQLVVRVYHNNNRCTPVLPIAANAVTTLRTATLSVTALYLLVTKLLFRAASPPNFRGQAVCDSMVFSLYAMRERFLAQHGAKVSGDHPFSEFTSLCVGNSVGTLRAHKEETEYRKKNPGHFGMAYFVYEPLNPKPMKHDIGEYKYMNSSGNPILKSSDRLFTPEAGLFDSGLAMGERGERGDNATLVPKSGHERHGRHRVSHKSRSPSRQSRQSRQSRSSHSSPRRKDSKNRKKKGNKNKNKNQNKRRSVSPPKQ